MSGPRLDRRRWLIGAGAASLAAAPVEGFAARAPADAPGAAPERPGFDGQSVWQFRVDTPGRKANAYLWIPPEARRVRAVIIGQTIVIEKMFLEDPVIRALAARESMALVWFNRNWGNRFVYDAVTRDHEVLEASLAALARASGYDEVATAPLVTIGHSASQGFAFNPAYWRPERVLAIVSAKAGLAPPPAWDPHASLKDTPILQVGAEIFELGAAYRLGDPDAAARQMAAHGAAHPGAASIGLTKTGSGHFEWSQDLSRYAADFIAAAARARLPARSGAKSAFRAAPPDRFWMVDAHAPQRFKPAPAPAYQGPPEAALRVFDARLARGLARFAEGRERAPQWLGFRQHGRLVPAIDGKLPELAFEPDADGESFSVAVERLIDPPMADQPEPPRIADASGVRLRVAGWGWSCAQIGPDRFRIRFNRGEDNIDKVIILAEHPGDARYRPVVQPVLIRIPLRRSAGVAQAISFPPLPELRRGAAPTPLTATASSGLPVRYYVKAGPAYVDHQDRLVLTELPVLTAGPLIITVVAYQWGRDGEPPVQTATPVVRTTRVWR